MSIRLVVARSVNNGRIAAHSVHQALPAMLNADAGILVAKGIRVSITLPILIKQCSLKKFRDGKRGSIAGPFPRPMTLPDALTGK